MANKVNNSYKIITGERCSTLAIVMGVVFILTAVLRQYFFAKTIVPAVVKILVAVWFLLAFIQQLMIIDAFTSDRSGFFIRLIHSLQCISFIPVIVSVFTMGEHFTLNNVFTRYLMNKYPTDEAKVFKIIVIWAVMAAVLLLVYLCVFLADNVISRIQWKVNIILVVSAVIAFCVSFPVVLAVPLVIVVTVVSIFIAIKLIIMLPQAIRDKRNAEKVDLGIGRGLVNMMDFITGSEYDSDAESARNQRTNAKVDREISKLESENKAYSNKIAEAREGYNKTFSDNRSQDSLINSRNKDININNKKIEELKKKKK